jgi:F-type H+-transporting ATPase subunit b
MSYESIAIWSRIIGTVVVLAMLWYVFVRFLAPAIARAQEAKNEEIAHAEQRRDAAKAEIAAARAEAAQAEHDAQSIRERAESDARREREQALAQARESGDRSVRNAEGELARGRVNAQSTLRIELIEKALDAARRDAEARVDPAYNAALVDKFLTSLEAGEARG